MQSYNTLSEIKIPIDDLMPNITNYAKSNAPPRFRITFIGAGSIDSIRKLVADLLAVPEF